MAELNTAPKVYNIQAGVSFADALVQGILERCNFDPMELASYTILLPSRRACRALSEAFLRHSKGSSLLLPAMHPLGDVDADEVAMLLADEDNLKDSLDIPPAVSKLERQLLLARLIQKNDEIKTFDQAVALALELGKFLDEVQTERLKFEDLANIVPEEFAGHWQKTLEFLKILTQFWPEILKERGLIDIAERRNLLIEQQVKAWTKNPPHKKIIAAGSIGPIPAAAELLALVAKLPNGMLVMPGLDKEMDGDAWDKIDDDHPQFFIKKLLKQTGIGREDVLDWELEGKQKINKGRVRLISEAMRAAETTDAWRKLSIDDINEHSLDGLTKIDCDTAGEEADVIAFIMREVLETPEKTCALITSDRRLARRVSQSLKRWNIAVDDSGGQPLTEFAVGSFLMLIAEMAEENLSPVTLLAFLKHSLMAGNINPNDLRDMVQFLDEYILRGPRHSGGFEGLREAAEKSDNKKFFDWLASLESQTTEFINLMSSKTDHNFKQLLTEHIKTAEVLATTSGLSGAERLWHGEAGEAAAKFLSELLNSAQDIPELKPEHYISIFNMLLKGNTVRPRFGSHPRLSILGQIESRLYCADMVILGGLNEGTWPKLPDNDPWMSRPMRKAFGLPAPEKDISLSAHDFAQAASAKEVILTRARKLDGTPTVPARWLLRIETVLKAIGLEMPEAKGNAYRNLVKLMDSPDKVQSTARPAPCPPLEVRPRKLSVTRIENWMRDPYQIYAKYILELNALDPLDADAGGAERGTFIHAALDKFVKTFDKELPLDADNQLLNFGREALDEMRIQNEVRAFWWPRFEKIVQEFVIQERKWRECAKPYLTETEGVLDIETSSGNSFTITGKADRIDKLNDGSYSIIDYKSGFVPDNTAIKAGFSPQLPLEAVILQEGGFDKIPQGTVSDLTYWKVTGSGQTPVERKTINPQGYSLEQVIIDAKEGLQKLVECFDDEKTPYLSQPRASAKPKFSDYEHLSRVKEWGISGDDEGEAA